MPPKPRSCNGSREKAQRRRPGRRAGSPLRLETLGLPRRGRPYPAGALPLWPESGWTRTDLYRTWRYRASLPMRARLVLSPTQPINRTGQTKGRMLLTRHPLGRGQPHHWPAQHVQTQLPTRPAADSRHSDRMTTADSDNGPGLATGPPSHRREDRPHIKPSEEPDRFDHDRHNNSKSQPRPDTIKAILGSALLPRAKFDNFLLRISPKPRLGPRIPGSPNFSPIFSLVYAC
jgi:hypothetical protein